MAKRSPERDKAFEIWYASGGKIPLKEIADKLGVPDTKIRKWKSMDKWNAEQVERSSGRSGTFHRAPGAPLGNKNGVGHGAPKGNKNASGPHRPDGYRRNTNAVTTGEYQTIWLDAMDADEQALFQAIDTDPVSQIDEDIRLLTYRERRMLTYLNELKTQKDLAEQKDVYEVRQVPVIAEIYDDSTGAMRQEKITQSQKVLVEQTVQTKMLIDKILRVEEALTRVQEKKIRAAEAKHRMVAGQDRAGTMSQSNASGSVVNVYLPSNGRDTDGA